MYRLGSLRLAKAIEEFSVSRLRETDLMVDAIDQTIEEISRAILPEKPLVMVALGSDIRFAATLLHPEWDRKSLISIRAEPLQELTRKICRMSADTLVAQHHLSYEDAETLPPALMIYSRLAKAFQLNHLLVAEVNLRSGLLAEMDAGGNWTAEFKNQIVSSALEVANRYHVDIGHARRVCAYCMDILDFLRKQHSFSPREQMILTVAALLHETGRFVNVASHHKHTQYLVATSDIFGLGRQDIELAALVARYHRRSSPKATHGTYMQHPREERLMVSKLAAILRLANALDCLKEPRRVPLKLRIHDDNLLLLTHSLTNLQFIQRRVASRSDLFAQIYGLNVSVRQKDKDIRI